MVRIAAEDEVRKWRLFMLIFQGLAGSVAMANPSVSWSMTKRVMTQQEVEARLAHPMRGHRLA